MVPSASGCTVTRFLGGARRVISADDDDLEIHPPQRAAAQRSDNSNGLIAEPSRMRSSKPSVHGGRCTNRTGIYTMNIVDIIAPGREVAQSSPGTSVSAASGASRGPGGRGGSGQRKAMNDRRHGVVPQPERDPRKWRRYERG